MKMVVEKLVNGQQVFEVVEAETATEAIHQCSIDSILNKGREDVTTEEDISYVGVYEVSQINLQEALEHQMRIHQFYREKVEQLGFNPDNFGILEN